MVREKLRWFVVFCREMMPQRRPVTYRSPKTPKGGSEQVGEASISATKKLKFSPKAESVIKMSQKNPSIPPPLFKDTNNRTASKVIMPSWLDLYKKNPLWGFPRIHASHWPRGKGIRWPGLPEHQAVFTVPSSNQDTRPAMCWFLRVDHPSCQCREMPIE